MPWNSPDVIGERLRFVRAVAAREDSVVALCRQYGISRATGHLWIRRAEEATEQGVADLHSRSHRPKQPRGKTVVEEKWVLEALALRQRRPTWGTGKLLAWLRRQHPQASLPSASTLWRRFSARGLIGRKRAGRRRGPVVSSPPPLARPSRCNAIWTLDFKGHFRVGSGQTCRPLTVRDLFSRYVLMVEHVAQPNDEEVRAAMTSAFARYGLPKAILVDNGAPFAGVGALVLTRLSLWWLRLGIAVYFTRRGKPQDNGAHEQMHRVLKAEAAKPPAATLVEQHARFQRWCRDYNNERPHAGIGNRVPAELYRRSRRKLHVPAPLRYPADCETLRVHKGGTVYWRKLQLMIGRAFEGEILGLRPHKDGVPGEFNVYLGRVLIGTLNEHAPDDMSPARYAHIRAQRSRRRSQARSEDLAAAALRSAPAKSSRKLTPPTRKV